MTNKEISRALRLLAALGELHGENAFKLKSLLNGAFQIDRLGKPLVGMSFEELTALPGIGKSLAQKICDLIQTGTSPELEAYRNSTPPGILELLAIKGIGPKKIAVLWKELGIEGPGELLYACNENRLVELKGFGEKTQQAISEVLQFALSAKGKMHFPQALQLSGEIIRQLKKSLPDSRIEFAGELRRCLETCDQLCILVEASLPDLKSALSLVPEILVLEDHGKELICKYLTTYTVRLIATDSARMATELLLQTGPEAHLAEIGFLPTQIIQSEEDFYRDKGLPFVLPELRDLPLAAALELDPKNLVSPKHIKGCIHAHSTWSDGVHSIQEMAESCIQLGYEYLAITDHSRSASYARGLSIEQVMQQHEEIDILNEKLKPFRIFKGIESDILYDGNLDYPETVLEKFDLVVASVHSVLRMDIQKATSRIVSALSNPFTTLLGHPSGRLLLSREGYPLDYEAILQEASKNQVVLELNANRFRMDIDWRHIPRCLSLGLMVSVNPDAHQKESIGDMFNGIAIARKGGLCKEMLFNGFSLQEMENWLQKRKKRE